MNRQSVNAILTSPWLLAAAIVLSFYATLGTWPLFDLDEGAFSEATREMIRGGNYLLTYLDGQPRYDKPILVYWLQAASVHAFGLNEFALRLPSAIAATFWVGALWGFGRQMLDEDSGTVAALLLACALVPAIIAKSATADALLNLWLALTFLDVYRYCRAPSRKLALRVYLWMGLGMLTKGPVAVALPLVVTALYLGSRREWALLRGAVINPLGWLVFLVVALPWYVAVYVYTGPGFFEGFFLKHNLGRFSDTMEGHGGSLGYYFVVLPLSLLPFTGWFLRILGKLRAGLDDPLDRYLWIWFGVVFVFFSFSSTQLPHYLLYGVTPLFLLMARHREALSSRWAAFLPPLGLFLLLVFLPEIVAKVVTLTKSDYEREMLARGQEVFGAAYRWITGLGVAATVLLSAWRRIAPWQGLVALGLVQAAVLNYAVIPAAAELQQGPVKRAAAIAHEMGGPVVAYAINMPSFSVYRDDISLRRAPLPGDTVFTRIDRLPKLVEQFPQHSIQTIYRKGGVTLVVIGGWEVP